MKFVVARVVVPPHPFGTVAAICMLFAVLLSVIPLMVTSPVELIVVELELFEENCALPVPDVVEIVSVTETELGEGFKVTWIVLV